MMAEPILQHSLRVTDKWAVTYVADGALARAHGRLL